MSRFHRRRILATSVLSLAIAAAHAADAPRLLFHVSADQDFVADTALGDPVPNFKDKVRLVDDGARGRAIAAEAQVGGQQYRIDRRGRGFAHDVAPGEDPAASDAASSSSKTRSFRSSHFSASSTSIIAAPIATITSPSNAGTGRVSNSACIHGV